MCLGVGALFSTLGERGARAVNSQIHLWSTAGRKYGLRCNVQCRYYSIIACRRRPWNTCFYFRRLQLLCCPCSPAVPVRRQVQFVVGRAGPIILHVGEHLHVLMKLLVFYRLFIGHTPLFLNNYTNLLWLVYGVLILLDTKF